MYREPGVELHDVTRGQCLHRHLDPTKLPGLQIVSAARLLTASADSRSLGDTDRDRLESVIANVWNAQGERDCKGLVVNYYPNFLIESSWIRLVTISPNLTKLHIKASSSRLIYVLLATPLIDRYLYKGEVDMRFVMYAFAVAALTTVFVSLPAEARRHTFYAHRFGIDSGGWGTGPFWQGVPTDRRPICDTASIRVTIRIRSFAVSLYAIQEMALPAGADRLSRQWERDNRSLRFT